MGLDFVELIISIEDAFDIAIEDEQASKVVTVDDCYKLILSQIGNREVKSWSDEQVWEAMKNIIAANTIHIRLYKFRQEYLQQL